MECLLPYLCIVIVPRIMVGLERMLDYRGVGLARFHCTMSYVLTTETQCCKQTLVAHTVHRILCVNVVYSQDFVCDHNIPERSVIASCCRETQYLVFPTV